MSQEKSTDNQQKTNDLPLHDQFQAWLEAHNAQIALIGVTPFGEKTERFLFPGWDIVITVVPKG